MLPLKYVYAPTGNKRKMVRKFASEKIIKEKENLPSEYFSIVQISSIEIDTCMYISMTLET
jgi:hypothetical protein